MLVFRLSSKLSKCMRELLSSTSQHGLVRVFAVGIQICVRVVRPQESGLADRGDSIVLGSLFAIVIIAGFIKVYFSKRRCVPVRLA